MARSSYIYIVTSASGAILSAFTVKHELITWCKTQDPTDCYFYRIGDGGYGYPVELTYDQLTSGKQIR